MHLHVCSPFKFCCQGKITNTIKEEASQDLVRFQSVGYILKKAKFVIGEKKETVAKRQLLKYGCYQCYQCYPIGRCCLNLILIVSRCVGRCMHILHLMHIMPTKSAQVYICDMT